MKAVLSVPIWDIASHVIATHHLRLQYGFQRQRIQELDESRSPTQVSNDQSDRRLPVSGKMQ